MYNHKSIIAKITVILIISIGMIFCEFCSKQAFAISISKEKELAVEFMETIEQQNRLIKDPMALALVSEIGEQILKATPPQPFKYSFYIANADQFNAFAGPGANIFVYRGLITSLDNVDELAGIIGHEIAHSSCRHVSDMVDQSKIMTIGTLAGVLAGVLVGATSGSEQGDIGQAVLVGSIAAGQTAMLSYSREHETEADQKGLVYITKAGFDPSGLLTGLQKIRSRDWFGSESIPDYLKTHPGSTERIVQIQSWIEEKGKANFRKSNIDPFRFQMVKCRLTALYGNEDDAEKYLTTILQKEPNGSAANYGMAILMERKSRLDESMQFLRKALETRAFDPYFLVEMGKINLLKGKPQKAIEIMQGLDTIPETEIEALFYLSQARLMLKMVDIAEKGFEHVVVKSAQLFPKSYYHLAEIKGQSGDKEDVGLSHYYLGLYYYEMQNMKSAKVHFIKSLESLSDNEKVKHAKVLIAKIQMRIDDARMDARRRRR